MGPTGLKSRCQQGCVSSGNSRGELSCPVQLLAAAAAAAAAAAKSLQLCPTLCNPIDGSPPGFSRQEHWSGLPFPPPMHESEK